MKILILIIVTIYSSVCLSQNQFNSGWKFQFPLPHGNTVFGMDKMGSNIIQAGEKGTFTLSTNNGLSFTLLPIQTDKNLNDAVIFSSSEFFAVGVDGGFRSTNSGQSWTKTLANIPVLNVAAHFGNTIYVGGDLGYIAKSTNNGINFTVVHNDPITDIKGLAAVTELNIYASGSNAKILHSTNGGATWVPLNIPVPVFTLITSIDFFDQDKGAASFSNGILITTNGGDTWITTNPGPNVTWREIRILSQIEMVAVGDNGNVARTTNSGVGWINTTFRFSADLKDINGNPIPDELSAADELFTSGEFNFQARSTNRGATWEPQFDPIGRHLLRSVILDDTKQRTSALGDTIYFVGDSGTVVRSTDLGETFQLLNSGTTLDLYGGHFFNGSTGYIVGGRGTTGIVLKTTDSGATWTQSNPLGDLTRDVYFIDEQTGIVCGSTGRVRRTTNGGANWVVCPIPSSAVLHSIAFVDANTGVIAAAFGNMVRTTDGGASWYEVGGLSGTLLSVSFTDMNTGVAVGNFGSFGSMYRTTNAGQNWTLLPTITQNTLYSVSMVGELGFACGTNFNDDCSILKSTNRGQTWFRTNSGTNNQLTGIVFINETTGIVTGAGGSILKTTNSGTPIAVEIISSTVPVSYSLQQNYPNPFNPTTKIRFHLPKSSQVKLEVYDITGRIIEQLADGEYRAGIYETDWNGSAFSSGVYFYRLVTEDFTETRKMILIK